MKCGVLYYDGFCEFEVVIALQNLAHQAEIVGVAAEARPYLSEEKQVFLPSLLLSEAKSGDFDVFLIPGGEARSLLGSADLKRLLLDMAREGKIIGAICGGVLPLGAFGLLKGKRFTGEAKGFEYSAEALEKDFKGATYTGEDVVIAGNIVTAMGQAFVEFGIEIADVVGFYPDERTKQRDILWFKNQ